MPVPNFVLRFSFFVFLSEGRFDSLNGIILPLSILFRVQQVEAQSRRGAVFPLGTC